MFIVNKYDAVTLKKIGIWNRYVYKNCLVNFNHYCFSFSLVKVLYWLHISD